MSTKTVKIIVILGTTASGKTTLGVKLAERFKGEIVSADSRQVYRGMDVGTGKDLREYKVESRKLKVADRERGGKYENSDILIRYHMIDVADPNDEFCLADYLRLARAAIADIAERGRVPIVVGGSGLYVQALVDGYDLPQAKPDKGLREDLETKSAEELYNQLLGLNRAFAERVNESDRFNKRRLIRYIETQTVGVLEEDRQIDTDRIQINTGALLQASPQYDALVIGLTWPKEVLAERIGKRLVERLENEDMVGEVDRLHNEGVSWKRLESFGLEYKYIAWYLQEKMDLEEMTEQLAAAIRKFAKKQMTWLRRWEKQGREMHWVKDYQEAEKLTSEFIG